MSRLLFVVSSATEIELADGSPHTIGFWPEEVMKPLQRFLAADVELIVATPDGRPPTPDPFGLEARFHYDDADEDFLSGLVRSFGEDPEDVRVTLHQLTELGMIGARRVYDGAVSSGIEGSTARSEIEAAAKAGWYGDRSLVDSLVDVGGAVADLGRDRLDALVADAIAASEAETARVAEFLSSNELLNSPRHLAELTDDDLAACDGVFIPGGHGPMVDLADNPAMDRVLRYFHERQKLIASLCHGPAAFLSAGNGFDGSWLFDGYRMTAFSDIEEDQVPVGRLGAPWYVEAELRNRGAVIDNAPAEWASHVVVDRNVITAQNPASSEAAADAVLTALDRTLELV